MCLAAAANLALGVPGPALAAGGTTCTVENPVGLNPGLTLQGSTGTFESNPLGTVACDGPVNGVVPTGPGSFLDKGTYGTEDPDDCLAGGEGKGSYTLTLPTDTGKKIVVLPFTVRYGAPSSNGGLVGIHTRGDGWVGEFGGVPTAGDCVVSPVTKVLATGTIVFQ